MAAHCLRQLSLITSALVAFTAAQGRADSFVTITPTGAGAAVVTNRWAIGSQLSGLGYIGGNSGFPGATATNFFTITGAAITAESGPGGFTSYVPTGAASPQESVGNALSPESYSGLTYVAENLSLIGPLSFYAIHHGITGDYLALIQPSVPTVSDQKPMSRPGGPLTAGSPGYFALSYAADNPGGWGAELFYYLRTNALGETIFGSLVPALLSGPTDQWNLGAGRGFTDLAYTSTDVGFGFGPSQFYYLRLDPVTQTTFFGRLDPLTGAATDIQDLGGVYRTLAFTTTDVGYGANNFYSIGLLSQTITFAAIPNHAACDAPFTFAYPEASSGLPVALSVSGPATVSGNIVTLTGAPGTVILTASQAGISALAPAQIIAQSFAVVACGQPALAPQTIFFNQISNRGEDGPSYTACDAPFGFQYPVASSGLPVTVTVSGPATVSGNIVTLTGALGTVVLTAAQAGNSTFAPAPTVTEGFEVNTCPTAEQTITFAAIPGHTACDAPFTFVYPLASSGLPVTLSVSGPATVSGNTVTLTGAVGTVVLTASQAGISLFAPAPSVAQSFAVAACAQPVLLSQTITFAAIPDHNACDSPCAFAYPVASSGLPVALAVSGPATVSGNTLTPTGAAGTVTLTASQAGNSIFTPAPAVTQSFAVAACPQRQTIYFAPIPSHTACDAPFTFGYPVASSGLPVTLVVAGPATVSGNTVTLTGALGFVFLVAEQAGDPTVAGANSVGQGFDVVACIQPAPPPQAITITSASAGSATVGSAFCFTVTSQSAATSFAATGLPPGLTLDASTGVISGTPTGSGVYTVSLTPMLGGVGSGPASVLELTVSPAAASPLITSAAGATGQVGAAFAYQLGASGSPTSYAVTSGPLPAGLGLNGTSGSITGLPTHAGTTQVWIAASNGSGRGLSLEITFVINAAPATPAITSNGTAIGQVGQPFSYATAASNDPTSYAASGLPPGLTLDSATGAIFGVPAAATTQPISVTLMASNANGAGGAATLLLTINPAPSSPVITTATAATGQAGMAFIYQLAASNSPTSFAALNLPAGLSLDPTGGAITGTPTQAGTFAVSVAAANPSGLGASTTLVLTVLAPLGVPVISGPASDSGQVGVVFSWYTINAAPGPISSYNLIGTLPPGLLLDSCAGIISGVPAQAGLFTVDLTAINSSGTSQPQPLELSIAPAEGVPAITSSLSGAATVGEAFSYMITATNVPGKTLFPPSVTLDAANLPPGLNVNPSTGAVAGTPTQPGTYMVGLQGVNETGAGSIAYLTITVAPAAAAPVVDSAAMAPAQAGGAFSYQIAATNNPTSYQVLNSPAWMTINSQTGMIGGTPPTAGSAAVQLIAQNAAGASAPLTLTVTITASPPT